MIIYQGMRGDLITASKPSYPVYIRKRDPRYGSTLLSSSIYGPISSLYGVIEVSTSNRTFGTPIYQIRSDQIRSDRPITNGPNSSCDWRFWLYRHTRCRGFPSQGLQCPRNSPFWKVCCRGAPDTLRLYWSIESFHCAGYSNTSRIRWSRQGSWWGKSAHESKNCYLVCLLSHNRSSTPHHPLFWMPMTLKPSFSSLLSKAQHPFWKRFKNTIPISVELLSPVLSRPFWTHPRVCDPVTLIPRPTGIQ